MKCTTEVGDAMDDRFMDGTQGEDAPPPPPPPVPDDPSAAPFSLSELRRFPMRSNCLSTHATLADLDPALRDRLARYFRDACEGLPEFASVFARAERLAGKYTRVKEIVESVEAFKVVVSFVATCERTGARQVRKFFDLACGHGLVGIMLAYAYPDRAVMACDRKRRESFEAFAEAFAHYASREENSPATFHDDEVEPEVEPGAAGSSRRSRRLPNLDVRGGRAGRARPERRFELAGAGPARVQRGQQGQHAHGDERERSLVRDALLHTGQPVPSELHREQDDGRSEVRVHVRGDGVRVRRADGEVHRPADHEQGRRALRRVRGWGRGRRGQS